MGFIAKEGKLQNLVSQWTVATILGCVAEAAPNDRTIQCAKHLGALQSQGVSLRLLDTHTLRSSLYHRILKSFH